MQNAKVGPGKQNEIVAKLIERFNYDKIINESYYIKRMSPKMMFACDVLLKDELFKNMPAASASQLVREVPFFKVDKGLVKIQYDNAEQVLIVAGVRKEVLRDWLDCWNRDYPHKGKIIKDINLGYWHIFQFSTVEWASCAKKYIRAKKGEKDLHEGERKLQREKKDPDYFNYKFPCRRVRIILLSEDFFTVLFDIFSQTMTEKFGEAIDPNNGFQPLKDFLYIPIMTSEKSQERVQEFDDALSSEILSQNSSAYHLSDRMKEIDVATSNQGTQIQSIGVEIQTEMEGQMTEQLPDHGHKVKGYSLQEHDSHGHMPSLGVEKEAEVQKIRTNSAYYPSSLQSSKIQQKSNEATKGVRKKQKKQKINQFPSLVVDGEKKDEDARQGQSKNDAYTRIEFEQMKRRVNVFRRENSHVCQPDIPKYIRRESEGDMFRHKFHDEVIRKARLTRMDRSISQI